MELKLNQIQLQSQIVGLILNGKTKELLEMLDTIIEHESEEILKNIIQALSTPFVLNLLIQEVVKTPVLFEKVIKDSYYHENGFHKIVLLSGRYFKLRVHQFGVASKPPMENIHDHRWPFASAILSGRLTMDMFSDFMKSSEGEDLYHFIYKSDKIDGSYETVPLGLKRLYKTESRTYFPGESYLMKTDELHRVKNSYGEESVTVILTGVSKSSSCNLYAKRPILEEEKKTIPYHPDVIREMLQKIIEGFHPQKN